MRTPSQTLLRMLASAPKNTLYRAEDIAAMAGLETNTIRANYMGKRSADSRLHLTPDVQHRRRGRIAIAMFYKPTVVRWLKLYNEQLNEQLKERA